MSYILDKQENLETRTCRQTYTEELKACCLWDISCPLDILSTSYVLEVCYLGKSVVYIHNSYSFLPCSKPHCRKRCAETPAFQS